MIINRINHLNLEQKTELKGTYNVHSQIKFKTTMLKSSLCHYSDAYILVKGTITIAGAGDDAELDKQMKEIKVWYLKITLPLLIV